MREGEARINIEKGIEISRKNEIAGQGKMSKQSIGPTEPISYWPVHGCF